ncbi:unnamed protein product [Larinioides sclopetarius]|uniref:Arginine-hydroxylase NDUFAF5, mitochondrial n=1 Tax=Larinioides sclopetarius TaxID=280406 RepID=A0AAV2AI19_9ARAC
MYFSPMKSKISSICFNNLIKRKFYSLPKKNYEKLLSFESISKPRYYSEVSLDVFDRNSKRMHRDWSASLHGSHIYDYIKDEIGDRVADRVYDITRKFSTAVELGCGKGHITKHLTPESIEMIYQCDISSKMLEKTKVSEDIPTFKMIVDEEYLPFADSSIDLFISSLNFHWINDLPSVFEQIHRALKPDGVLIASMFGGDSLFELRSSLQLAETEREGGFSPHISPFARIRDIGDLLTRAGYTMLTI